MAVKYHTVASAIAEMIRDGQVADGDRLPSEADLAETYNVSRATIPNALALLEQVGEIDQRRRVAFRGQPFPDRASFVVAPHLVDRIGFEIGHGFACEVALLCRGSGCAQPEQRRDE